MRGINRVILSGNATSSINYSTTGSGSPVCTFVVASSRPGANGSTVSSYVKINAYSNGLVDLCRSRLRQGSYIIVEGELMNRDGKLGELTEVRARDLVFVADSKSDLQSEET